MLVAVMSDTHDHKTNILKAVSIMNKRGVEALIHCGDFIAPFVKRWFDNLNDQIKKNFYGTFGNNDGELLFLEKNLGQICELQNELVLEFGGKRIHASHSPKSETIEALAKSGEFDIILSGHTHEIINQKKENGVLILNPGECCGYLSGTASFAIIDTNSMEAEIIKL